MWLVMCMEKLKEKKEEEIDDNKERRFWVFISFIVFLRLGFVFVFGLYKISLYFYNILF